MLFKNFYHKVFLILVLFFLENARCSELQKINYQISPSVVKGMQCVHVTANTTLDSTGEVDFSMIDRVYNFSYRMSKETKVNFEEKTRRLTAIDKPYARAEFSYDHCAQDSKSDLRLSIINKEYFYLEFLTALIFPVNVTQDWHQKWPIEIEFKNFPENFKFYGSYPLLNKKIEVVDSFQNFFKSAIWASKYDAMPVSENKKNTHFVYIGNNKKSKQKCKMMFQQIEREQRHFWKDQDDSPYTIVLLDNAFHQGTRTMVGKHAFRLCSYLIDLNKDQTGRSIHEFSHEFFHKWLGDKMNFPPYPHDLTWLLEGFTEYYGQKLAQQAGVLSKKEVTNIVNHHLIGYYQLPIKNVTQAEFISSGNKDLMYYILETLKGYFIAAKLDNLKDARGEPLLPIILRELLSTYKKQSDVELLVSKKMVFDIFSRYLPKEQIDEIKDITENGKTIKFNANCMPGNIAQIKEIRVPDFSFNLHDLITKKIITGLKKDSSAFKAGLRDNMKIVSHDIGLTDLKHNVTMHYLDEKGAVQVIQFKPERKKIAIPQI